jgi:hypothetical protein
LNGSAVPTFAALKLQTAIVVLTLALATVARAQEAQPQGAPDEPWSLDLTVHDFGIGIGNSKQIHGLRLNFRDVAPFTVHGVNATVWSPSERGAGDVTGLALGIPVTGAGTLRGLGLGFGLSAFNRIRGEQRGLAIGILNYTPNLHGVQIGLVNWAGNNPSGLKLLPIVNAHLD